jgi:hypothetical protein
MATSTDLAELIEKYESGQRYRLGPLPVGRHLARVTAVGAAPTKDDEILLFVGVTVLGGLYDGTRVPVLGVYTDDEEDPRWDTLTQGILDCCGVAERPETVLDLYALLLDKVVDLEVTEDPEWSDDITDGDVTFRPADEEVVDKWRRT